MPIEIRQDLINQIKKGDKHAFGKLVELSSQYVYKVAFKILGDSDEARDASQDSFVKVWEKIKSYDDKYKFTTWLYKIVMNTCLDKLRKCRRNNEVINNYTDRAQLKADSGNPSIRFEENQLIEFVKVISCKLSDKQHMVFVLHDLEDFNQDEIAEILEMPKNRVKSNLYYARKSVRHMLKLTNENITEDGM